MREVSVSHLQGKNDGYVREIEEESGQKVSQCYQCGKCSGGCPMSFAMDYPPNQIMRMLQVGLLDEVLNSTTIWVCASCLTCSSRCPRGIDIAQVMDNLRMLATKRGTTAKGKNALIFHEVFLNSVKNNGRLYELGLAMQVNLKTGNLFKDAELGLPMFLKGKLKLLPHKIKGTDEINKIFAAAKQMEAE